MPDRRRLRSVIASAAVLGCAVVLAVVVPGTSSAFSATVRNSADTASAKARFTCADTFAADRRRSGAYFEFALDDPAGSTTAADSSSAGNPGSYEGANAKDGTRPAACSSDRGAAYGLDGSTSRITTGKYFAPITGTFSEEVWFKTTTPGKILGFESTVGDRSNNYDKHLYVDTSGRLVFGIYNYSVGVQTLRTSTTVADGAWHYAVATTSDSGSILYLDGQQVDANASFTTAEPFGGYWRIGQGHLEGWPDAPNPVSSWFTGSLRFAAAYSYVLTPREVASAASFGVPGGSAQPTTEPSSASPSASASASASASDPSPSASASEASSDSPSASAVPVHGAHPSMGTIEQAPTTEDTLAAAPDQ